MAADWGIERVERTPKNDPDPATYAFTAVLRDKTSGARASVTGGFPKTDWVTGVLWLTAFCTAYGDTYTPNDFGCE